jgi:proteasome lid subunit RPN8/RPN11
MNVRLRQGYGGQALVIASPELDAIRAHAEATYPDECCGALLGATIEDGVTGVVERLPLPNTTEEGPRRRFLVSAADYRAAEARSRETGIEIVGFYHSHPDHPAHPSAYDLDHAWPNLSYVIVSVVEGHAVDARSWRLRDDRSSFLEETIRRDDTTRTDHGYQSVDSDSTSPIHREARRDRR